MFFFGTRSGSAKRRRTNSDSVLLLDGRPTRLLDRDIFEQALIEADARFEQAVEELRAQRRESRSRDHAA